MAEALYRKYRPQTFEDVVGQTHIERTLKNAIESDKVSHAYLFCGPRGTGKTTTARLLAKALLCEHGPTPSPDGTCEQCLAIAEGNHPDVNELDAASRTGVENVREEIIGRVQYAPTRGRYKIYIIDEVHMRSMRFSGRSKSRRAMSFSSCAPQIPRRFPKPFTRVASASTSIVFPTTRSCRVLVRCAWPKEWSSKAMRSTLPRIVHKAECATLSRPLSS